MEKIAMIAGERFLYWSPLILSAAVLCGILLFLTLWLRGGGDPMTAAAAVPLALMLSLILGRLTHWYCRTNSYPSLIAAMTDFSSGGFALMGAFFGCLLTALILGRGKRNTARLLDCMSLGGCLAIALGRLGSFFNASDRGMPVSLGLPWGWPVVNAVSGEAETRLATFLLQALAAGILLVGLLIFGRKKRRDGDVCLIFLLCCGATQVVLDSTRYDSLFLRSNGFVSAVQILGAAALLGSAGVFLVRACRRQGGRTALLSVPMLALLGGAGYMEYHVQRHGNEALFAYTVMGLCLLGYVLLALWLRHLGEITKTPGGKFLIHR